MRIIIKFISVLLIINGIIGITMPLYSYMNEKKETDKKIVEFMNVADMRNNTSTTEGGELTEVNKDPPSFQGVLTIDSINLTAPIKLGTDESTLKQYVGMYEELNRFDEPGVVGLASHSTSSIMPCHHCYFQDIPTLQEGDIINIAWFDLKKQDYSNYKYVVYEIRNWEKENTPGIFVAEEGKEILVLQTCTNGKHGIRTYVKAERIDKT